MRIAALLLLCTIVLSSCVNRSEELITDSGDTMVLDNSEAAKMASLCRFTSYDFIDTSITNTKFLSCLVPYGWDVSYKTKAVTGDRDYPLKYGIVAEDTDAIHRFELYPIYNFVTNSNFAHTSRDSIEKNKDNVMRVGSVSATAVDAIEDFIIPYCRKDLSNFHISDEKTLKSLDQALQNVSNQSETGSVKIYYNIGEMAYEEIFFATIQRKYVSINGYDSRCEWQIKYACSFRTLKGQLNDEMGVLQTVIGSIRPNYDWYYKYNHALANLPTEGKYSLSQLKQAFNDAPRLKDSKEIVQAQSKMREMAKAFDIYTIYNIQIDAYINTDGNIIRLPRGYNIAWKGATGDGYLLAENAAYVPANKSAWVGIKRNESIIGESYLIGCEPSF